MYISHVDIDYSFSSQLGYKDKFYLFILVKMAFISNLAFMQYTSVSMNS